MKKLKEIVLEELPVIIGLILAFILLVLAYQAGFALGIPFDDYITVPAAVEASYGENFHSYRIIAMAASTLFAVVFVFFAYTIVKRWRADD